MKLYRYDKLEKLNQALGSFKRNNIPVIKVQPLLIDKEIKYFVLTDPKHEPKPQEKILKSHKKLKLVTKKGKKPKK